MKNIMRSKFTSLLFIVAFCHLGPLKTQAQKESGLLTIERIYNSGEFRQEGAQRMQWIEEGEAYVSIERSKTVERAAELIRYSTAEGERSIFVPAESLLVNGKPLRMQSFTLSEDGTKVLFFTNSSRVWRSNTKGDYWVYDFSTKKLTQLGKEFASSSLMFAKFSNDNQYVAYVHDFNIYKEEFTTGQVTQLTFDGTGDIINGTFDWAYEEEFGKRDGFTWCPNSSSIAFWQVDASEIGTHYMINYTDSVYSQPVPLQYPKVGETPSSAKVGVIHTNTKKIEWIPIPGVSNQNYIPGIQWVNDDLLLLQQLNRKQNHYQVWAYQPSTKKLKQIYDEKEDTWVDIGYPDISANNWGQNDLPIVSKGTAFLRMTEKDGWRHIYKVNLENGDKTLLTPGGFDVASMRSATKSNVYFIASPINSTQRYLFSTDLKGKGKKKRLTPDSFSGTNSYNVSPNGKYAVHSHQSINDPNTVRLISLPDHKTIKVWAANKAYKEKLASLNMPEIKFKTVKIEGDLEIDVRMILPTGFDANKKYPVLFHVYGEPWGQVATDEQVGLWNIMMAQKGYVVIDMDNRGTPCLKGSAWRKSIYRKIGLINVKDQALAAKEVLKLDYLDNDRTAVWGWSGGGTMTLHLLFQYPEIYKTGVAVASVSNQLIYDNIYQERYMGLPQENMEDFVKGSPLTYAKNLEGNLLLIHGTGDDNVHYQSAEMLINELIKENKQFQVMPYPNRSHGIYEGSNTTRHLYTLITNYILEHTPPNE